MEKRLDIKITGDNSGFARAANATVGMLNKIGSAANLLGVGSLAAIGYKLKEASAWAGSLKDASLQIGVSVESLQAFERAGAAAGLTLEDIVKVMRDLQRSQAQALGGSKSDILNFEKMGYSLEKIRGLDAESLFKLVAKALQESANGSESLNVAMEMMGKSGGKALAAIRDGLIEVAEEIKRTKPLLSTLEVDRLDELDDRMTDLGIRSKGFFGRLGLRINDFAGQVHGGLSAFAYNINPFYTQEQKDARQLEIYRGWGMIPKESRVWPTRKGIIQPPGDVGTGANPAFQSSMAEYDAMMAADAAARTRATTRPMAAADALARVGGFRGGGADSTQRTLREHTQLLKRAVKELEDLNRED